MKKKVLILCTGNSCRSQMAQGLLKRYGASQFEVHSAGTKPSHVNPAAIKVMQEIDIDISKQRSKNVAEFKDKKFDIVITVCENAKDSCPSYLKTTQSFHWSFPDPPQGKLFTQEVLEVFRQVRDAIKKKFTEELIVSSPQSLGGDQARSK